MIGPATSFGTAILLNGIASTYFSWSNRGGSFSEDLPVPPLKKAVSTAAGATASATALHLILLPHVKVLVL